ncbi:MAG: ATP synthase F1 subunit epsilon [Planctomycetota bacterium]
MADKTFRLRLVAPDRVVFDAEVQRVRVPGIDGSFGVLPGHAPLMTATEPGLLLVVNDKGQEIEMLVGDGFVEVSGQCVTIAAEAGEEAHEIDIEKAREAEKHARDLLSNRAALAEEDVLKAESELRLAAARQFIGQRRGGSFDKGSR